MHTSGSEQTYALLLESENCSSGRKAYAHVCSLNHMYAHLREIIVGSNVGRFLRINFINEAPCLLEPFNSFV